MRHDLSNVNCRLSLWPVAWLLGLAFVAGCDRSDRQAGKAPPARPRVMAAPVRRETITVYKDYAGLTVGRPNVQIRARVEGFLDEMLFDEGTIVQEGQILYRIDDRFLRARVEREEGELARRRAIKTRADRELARIKPLYETNAASEKVYEQAVAAAAEADASMQVTQAALDDAALRLSLTEIKSPLTGLVGTSLVDIGSLVGTQSEYLLTTVVNLDPIHVRFHMTDMDYVIYRRLKEKAGEKLEPTEADKIVSITMPDGAEYEYKGYVKFAEPQFDPLTGTYAVQAVFPNPDLWFATGQHTRIRLEMGTIPDALLVPQSAVQYDQQLQYVYVVGPDSRVEQRFIETAQSHEDAFVVARGLAAGETVVTEGMHKVRPGLQVTIAADDREPAEAPTTQREET